MKTLLPHDDLKLQRNAKPKGCFGMYIIQSHAIKQDIPEDTTYVYSKANTQYSSRLKTIL